MARRRALEEESLNRIKRARCGCWRRSIPSRASPSDLAEIMLVVFLLEPRTRVFAA